MLTTDTEIDLSLPLRCKPNVRRSKLECKWFFSVILGSGVQLFFKILMGFEVLSVEEVGVRNFSENSLKCFHHPLDHN